MDGEVLGALGALGEQASRLFVECTGWKPVLPVGVLPVGVFPVGVFPVGVLPVDVLLMGIFSVWVRMQARSGLLS